MPRKKHPRRSLREIFTLGNDIGAENVLLNDYELGAVLAGTDEQPLTPGTIANRRYYGTLGIPVVRTGRTPRTRLSDAIGYIERKTGIAA